MADSRITKQALAVSLKELMREVPFDKISVAQICAGCGMNRKSFYYHFRDKYDLVNWIFDTEFAPLISPGDTQNPGYVRWDLIEEICGCFYQNRDFYRKAFRITGQNSFSEHFMECIGPCLEMRLVRLLGNEEADEFSIDFYTDAVLCAIKRWLLRKDCIPPELVVAKLRRLVESSAQVISQEMTSQAEDP